MKKTKSTASKSLKRHQASRSPAQVVATPAPTSGYSGTPLAKKLGIAEGATVYVVGAPDEYALWLAPLPPAVTFATKCTKSTRLVHLFLTERDELAKHLEQLRGTLADDVPIWISWPKKAAKVPTTITEDVIREVALPIGFVDIKVCAVSDIWSGLKLVVRKELRKS